MGLNYEGPRMCGFFSPVNTADLHEPQLVGSADVEPQIGRNRRYGGITYKKGQL